MDQALDARYVLFFYFKDLLLLSRLLVHGSYFVFGHIIFPIILIKWPTPGTKSGVCLFSILISCQEIKCWLCWSDQNWTFFGLFLYDFILAPKLKYLERNSVFWTLTNLFLGVKNWQSNFNKCFRIAKKYTQEISFIKRKCNHNLSQFGTKFMFLLWISFKIDSEITFFISFLSRYRFWGHRFSTLMNVIDRYST